MLLRKSLLRSSKPPPCLKKSENPKPFFKKKAKKALNKSVPSLSVIIVFWIVQIYIYSAVLKLSASSACDRFNQEVALLPRDVSGWITQHWEPRRRGRPAGGRDASVCVTEPRWSSSVGEMSARGRGLAREGCGVQTPAPSLTSSSLVTHLSHDNSSQLLKVYIFLQGALSSHSLFFMQLLCSYIF